MKTAIEQRNGLPVLGFIMRNDRIASQKKIIAITLTGISK